jgi:hypothetical protein
MKFMDKDKQVNLDEAANEAQQSTVHDRPGSNDHNDYKIQGTEKEEHRNEKESYQDYNGNSETNNPARAGS